MHEPGQGTGVAGSLARGVAAWALAGAGIGAVVAWGAARANGSLASAGDRLVFAGWIALAYALLGAVSGLAFGLALAALRPRRDPPPRPGFHAQVVVALATFGAYVAGSWAITSSSAWGLEVDRRSVAGGLAAAAATALVTAALGARSELGARLHLRGAATALATGALLFFGVGLAVGGAHEEVPADPGVPVLAGAEGRPRVVLIGIDGADWRVLRELLAGGRMPMLASLVMRGAQAPLRTLVPTWSPSIWTTVATGQPPERHGVLDFTEIPLPGMSLGVQRLRVLERLALQEEPTPLPVPPHVGLSPLIYGLVNAGVLREQPIRAYHRRVKALWNVLSDQDLRVAVLRWWATWPAEHVHGCLVSDNRVRATARAARDPRARAAALASGTTYPPELVAELGALEGFWEPRHWWDDDDPRGSAERTLSDPAFRDLPEELRPALLEDWGALRLAHNMAEDDRFAAAAAEHLLARGEVDFLAVYLQGTDGIAHRIEEHARRDARYVSIVRAYHEVVDELLGRLLAHDDGNTVWVLVSDHGWSFEPERYGHYHGPPGILLMAGPGVRAGVRLATAPHVLDVAPTLLALLGLPASEEMDGEPFLEALDGAGRARAPGGRIDTFGPHRPRWSGDPGAAAEEGGSREEMLEQLRELGYVQ